MRTPQRVPAVVVLCSVATGCSLPARENAYDPVNAPTAVLRVVDRGDGCPAPSATAPYTEIVAASRGRCLALDARDSISPKDHELAFVFTIQDTAGNVLVTVAAADGIADLAPLDGHTRTLPFDEPLVAHVSVTDTTLERTVEASATFSLENSPPVLVLDRPRLLPLGGLAWAPGADFTVRFSVDGSSDPDGDPLYLSLEFPDGEVEIGPQDLPFVDRAVPDVRGPFLVRARIFDGPAGEPRLAGRPGSTVVRVREPDPWMHFGSSDMLDAGSIVRIDGSFESYFLPTTASGEPAGIGGITYTAQSPIFYVHDGSGTIRTRSWPDGVALSSLPLTGGGSQNALTFATGSEGEVWRVGSDAPRIERYQIAEGSGAIALVAGESGTGLAPTALSYLATIDAQGRLWATAPGDSGYVVATLSGAAGSEVITPVRHEMSGRAISALAARPDSTEVWMLDDDAVDGGDPRLHRLTAPGTVAQTWDLDAQSAPRMAWAGGDSLWIAHDALGVVRLDALLLDQGIEVAEASVLNEFPVFGVSLLLGDPTAGTVFVSSGAFTSSWRLETNGRLVPLGAEREFFAVDPDGAALYRFFEPGAPVITNRASSPAPGGRDHTMPFEAVLAGAQDPVTGGAWLYRFGEEIVHVDAEGGVLARRSKVDFGTGPEPLPALGSFRPSRDGSHAWAIEQVGASEPGRLFYFDLLGDPMPARVVMGDTDDLPPSGFATLVGVPRLPILEPFAPDGRKAWVVFYDVGTIPTVVEAMILGTDGTLTSVPSSGGDIPEFGLGGVPDVRAAASAKSNALCLAAYDFSAGEIHVRRIHEDGTVEVFVTTEIPVGAGASLVGAATSWTDTEELCWVGWDPNAGLANPGVEIRAFADAGAVAERSHTVGNPAREVNLLGFLPYRDQTVWAAYSLDFGFSDVRAHVRRVDFAPAAQTEMGVLRSGTFGVGQAAVFLSADAPVQRKFP